MTYTGVVLLIALSALPASGWCQAESSTAQRSLEHWRVEAARARLLADNDAPGAYRAAKALESSLPPQATDSDRARVLNLLSRAETYLALTDLSSDHARQALDLASRIGDRAGQAEADLNIALDSVNQGRLDEMVAATQNSVAALEGVNRPDLLAEALLRTTAMYRRFEQFDESVAVAVRAMEIARRSNNPLVLAYAHQGLAIAYDQSYRYPEALEHYTQMRVQARAAHNLLLEAFAVSGLAGMRRETGDVQAAERDTREAIEMYRRVGAPFATSYALYGLADLLGKRGSYPDALRSLDAALDIYEHYPNRISQWFALNARSIDYQSLGQVDKADADAEHAYAIAQALGEAIYLSGSATRLASLAAAKGDYQRAYTLSVEASEMTAKAAREKAGPRVVQLVNRYESENRRREIADLTRRSELQSAQLTQRELQQRWLWTVLIGVIAALVGVALFVLRLRQSQRELEQRVQARTQELRQQTRYLRALIDTLPMLAWLKDTKGRYLVVNHAHAAARGHTAAGMEGQSDQQLLPPALAQLQQEDDRAVMESLQRKTIEECLPNDDGGVWMETYKTAVLDEDGTVIGMVGVSRNISERKAAEAAREVALSEARRLAHQRSQFLAHMSHELRTPLNAMMGFAQILQRDESLTERAAKAIRVISESGQHLLRLVNDILDLARIDAGKLELFPSEINLAVFLQIVCDTIQVRAEDKGLRFVFEPAADLPETVCVDEKRLRQVLLNLLSNAVKFTDSGQVTLRVTRVVPLGETSSGTPAHLRFEVEDHGIGMSERELARVFQPFEQVADARRREGGAGLGLAISRQLLHLMGGEIRVRSRPGEGSVFSFEIETPATQAQVAVHSEEGVPIGYLGERRRILVTDDVPENRAVLVGMLGALDFQTSEAANGWDTLKEVARSSPDLVLIDLAMPLMDGWETIRALRRTPEGAEVAIVATSAGATAEVESSSQAAGANAFVGKPIQEAALLEVIATLLRLEWLRERPKEQLGDS
jgi:PAS domain S-box-containing protein